MVVKRVIYQETQEQFFRDVIGNTYLDKMLDAADNYKLSASFSEKRSWGTNASKIKELLELSDVKDTYVTFEYLLPYRQSRIDCMLYGRDINNKGTVIHIELKQWDNPGVITTESAGNFTVSETDSDQEQCHDVKAFTGGTFRKVSHPSQQVRGYHDYLTGFVDVISKKELRLEGVAYCYNYRKEKIPCELFDTKYDQLIKEYRTYAGDEVNELAMKLKDLLGNGDGLSVFNKMTNSPIRPSKKLLESAANLIHEGNMSEFALIDEQIIARNTILDNIRKIGERKSVVIIKGGPGTGKTVIALHLLAMLAGKKKKIHYATKSKALLEGLKSTLPRGSKAKFLLSNVTQFIPANFSENDLDILLIDEAHRISHSANHQYTKNDKRTDLSQIQAIVRSSKITVFFIDDKQAIRSAEIGSSELVRKCAKEYNAYIEEIELKSQFRCNGSDNYLDWVEQVMYDQEVKSKFTTEEFDFKIFSNPLELYEAIKGKDALPNTSARLTAGFCWPWSKHLDENGELIKDVCIGNLALPWETHGEIEKKGQIPKGYVKWYEWAYKPEGIKQVGCIYTAQGFEFDYIGVIVGEDLGYSHEHNRLVTNIEKIKDPTLKRGTENFDTYVRNIYRVLMSRGMKGCYVYFVNKDTEHYFRKCLDIKTNHIPKS